MIWVLVKLWKNILIRFSAKNQVEDAFGKLLNLGKTNGCIWNDFANSFFGVVILNTAVVVAM